jgi:hypothetical protein
MNSRVRRFVNKHLSDANPPEKFTIMGRTYVWADVTKQMGIDTPNKDTEVKHESQHHMAETQPSSEDPEPGSRACQSQE